MAKKKYRVQVVLTIEVNAKSKTNAREKALKFVEPFVDKWGLKIPKDLKQLFMVEEIKEVGRIIIP